MSEDDELRQEKKGILCRKYLPGMSRMGASWLAGKADKLEMEKLG